MIEKQDIKHCERAEIGKQTGLKILRVVTPLWVQVPPLAPILINKHMIK